MIHPVAGSPKTAPQADPKLQKAAQGFEAIFLREILSKSLPKVSGGLSAYGDMMGGAMAEGMAQSGGLGLAAWIVRQQAKVPGKVTDNSGGTHP